MLEKVALVPVALHLFPCKDAISVGLTPLLQYRVFRGCHHPFAHGSAGQYEGVTLSSDSDTGTSAREIGISMLVWHRCKWLNFDRV